MSTEATPTEQIITLTERQLMDEMVAERDQFRTQLAEAQAEVARLQREWAEGCGRCAELSDAFVRDGKRLHKWLDDSWPLVLAIAQSGTGYVSKPDYFNYRKSARAACDAFQSAALTPASTGGGDAE